MDVLVPNQLWGPRGPPPGWGPASPPGGYTCALGPWAPPPGRCGRYHTDTRKIRLMALPKRLLSQGENTVRLRATFSPLCNLGAGSLVRALGPNLPVARFSLGSGWT